jgi:hypothetical protein
VGHLGEERPQRDQQLGVEIAGDGDDLVAERPPPQLRLVTEDDDDVSSGVTASEELRAWPVDVTDPVLQPHLGPGGREVEELLRVDLGERPRRPPIAEPAGGRRCGVAGVVPPLERGDHDRSPEGRTARPAEVIHGPEGTGAPRSGGSRGDAPRGVAGQGAGEVLDGLVLRLSGAEGVLGIAYGARRAERCDQRTHCVHDLTVTDARGARTTPV